MHSLLQALETRGWTVKRRTAARVLLPPDVAQRYTQLPLEVSSFLSSIEVCCNKAENVWFLTAEDYSRPPGHGFCWNEYEHMSLESAEDDRRRKEIAAFWDTHFPFMLAVHSDYDYLAVRLTARGFGAVVHGYVPEWESPGRIASSFEGFLKKFTSAAGAAEPESPFHLFL